MLADLSNQVMPSTNGMPTKDKDISFSSADHSAVFQFLFFFLILLCFRKVLLPPCDKNT